MARVDYFVGRDRELSQILGAGGAVSEPGGFFIVTGEQGSGKTWLLDELARTVREQHGAAIHIRCEHVPRRWSSDEAAEVRQFQRLMEASVGDPDRLPAKLNDAVDSIENSQSSPDHAAETHAGYGEQETLSDPHDLDETIGDLAAGMSVLAKQFTTERERQREPVGNQRERRQLMILVDHFDLLAGRPLGGWVMQMLERVEGATVVVARADLPQGGQEPPEPPGRARKVRPEHLSKDDVEDYLRKRLGGPAQPRVVQSVWEFTHGQPRALALVTDLITQDRDREQAARDIWRLGALAGKPELQELVGSVFTAIKDEGVRDRLKRLCVTPRFNKPLLMRLLDEIDEESAAVLIDQIRGFSFVTEAEDDFFAIDAYVRDVGQSQLARERRQKIHEVAAAYFSDLITAAVDAMKEEGPWSHAWYRYDDPGFRSLVKDWLYHVARLAGRERQSARLKVAQVFLDAFWWWGCYVPFDLCEDILDDWDSVVSAVAKDDPRRKADQKLADAMRALYDGYPKCGRLEKADDQRWERIRDALINLGGRGLTSPPDEPSQFHGLLAGYLAEALAWLNPQDPDVDDLLAYAIGAVDDYPRVWMNYARAWVALRRGELAEAVSLAKVAAQAGASGDHEVTARLHQVCADALWKNGEHGLALDALARAVAHAYAVTTESEDYPDPYTAAFQQEMTDRCMERMTELRSAGDADSRAVMRTACERIRALFGPYWQAVRADPVPDVGAAVEAKLAAGDSKAAAEFLLPVCPDPAARGNRYEAVCKLVTRRMGTDLDQPPGTPLPAAGSRPA